jgi:hypothetical protein
MNESNSSNNNEKIISPTLKQKKNSIDPSVNHIVSEYINCFKYDSTKSLIDHLESTTKILQRSLFKPETKKDIKNENLLNYIDCNPDDLSKIIGLFQKRITELKSKVNLDFVQQIQINDGTVTSVTSSSCIKLTSSMKIIPEEAYTNYFFVEQLDEFEDNSNINKNNINYIIIICPHLKIIYLLADPNKIPLGWSNLNSILNDSCSSLEKIFNRKIEDFIVENSNYYYLDITNLCEKIEIKNEIKLDLTNKQLSLENFSLKKICISKTNPYEELKSLFLEQELHKHFISTNNTKLMKNLLECKLNYYTASNQIFQMNFI